MIKFIIGGILIGVITTIMVVKNSKNNDCNDNNNYNGGGVNIPLDDNINDIKNHENFT